MDEFFPNSQTLRKTFYDADLSIESFVQGCELIYEAKEDVVSSDLLAMEMSDLTETDFQTILEILDNYQLVELEGRDYVILATDTEFQVGMGKIMTDLLDFSLESHRISWAIEDKMMIIREKGNIRFSTSIFFRWCEVVIYLLNKNLFVNKSQLLDQFSLMTVSRNNYCIRVLEQQELVIDTPVGIFLLVHLVELEEWLENMKEDMKMGYDLGS